MQVFNVSRIQDIDVYKNATDAFVDSERTNAELKANLTFDVCKFQKIKLIKGCFSYESISLVFENGRSIVIRLDDNGQLIMEETNNADPHQPDLALTKLQYIKNGIEVWSPKKTIDMFVGKTFKDIWLNRNWFFLYFSNMDVILSISVLCVEEPPFRILYCYDTI